MSLPPWDVLVHQLPLCGSARIVASMLIEDPDILPRYSLFYVRPEDAVMITTKFKAALGQGLSDYFDCPVMLQIRMWPVVSK